MIISNNSLYNRYTIVRTSYNALVRFTTLARKNYPAKQSVLFCVCILSSLFAMGQGVESRQLSLEEAIARSIQRSPQQKVEQMKVEEARLQLKDARLQHIPTLNASGDVRRNLIIPSTPVPAYLFNPDAGEDETMYLKFNTEWNASAGLNLAYDLFNPEKVYVTNERKQQLKIQEYEALISEREARAQVIMAYAECIITLEQLQSLERDTTYFAYLFNMSDTLYKREKVPMTERNDARRVYNESKSNYLMAEKIARDSKAELLYLMGEEITPEAVDLLHPVEGLPELLEKIEGAFSAFATESNLEERKQNEMVGLAKLRVKSAALKYAPTLTLNGYFGSNLYNRELALFNTSFWRGYSYVGLSVSLPITQSFHTANEVSRLQLQQQIETENLRDLRNAKAKETLGEQSLLEVRRENYRLSLENLKLSQENMRAAQVQFEKGHVQQQDLLNEQRTVQNARQSYLQSAYDMISSFIALEKTR